MKLGNGWAGTQYKELHMSDESRRDKLLRAIALSAMFIGMATGNGLAMLVMSAAGLVVMKVLGRERLMSWSLLVALAAAVTAVVVLKITQ
jgi:hypothetical protein